MHTQNRKLEFSPFQSLPPYWSETDNVVGGGSKRIMRYVVPMSLSRSTQTLTGPQKPARFLRLPCTSLSSRKHSGFAPYCTRVCVCVFVFLSCSSCQGVLLLLLVSHVTRLRACARVFVARLSKQPRLKTPTTSGAASSPFDVSHCGGRLTVWTV